MLRPSLLADPKVSDVVFRRAFIRSVSIWAGAIIALGIPLRHLFFTSKLAYLPGNLLQIVIFALIPYLLKKRQGSENLCGYLLVANFAFLGVNGALLNAGVRAPVTVAFMLLPLLGMLCCGKRGGLVGLILTLVIVPALVWIERAGWVMKQDAGLEGYLAAVLCIGAGVSYSIAAAYENSRRRSEEALLEVSQALAAHSKLGALGEMAAGVAHEIHNPLSIVYGKAEHARARLDAQGSLSPEEMRASLDKIIHSSQRITKIVNGLRAISRGAENDPLTAVEVGHVLDDTLDLCFERFKSHGVTLDLPSRDEHRTIRIRCREVQLVQVLINLLNNAFDAIEALPEKWVRIEVSPLPNGRAQIAVVDAGPGIEPQVVEKMMQPFFTTKPPGKGTGLGLAISKGLIERQGGRLYYDPSSERTRFVLELSTVA